VLAVSVLGSGIAALDATVVNIALPTIGRDFRTGVAAMQWVMNGYTLAVDLLHQRPDRGDGDRAERTARSRIARPRRRRQD
jgi:hypothetical protein